VVYADRTSEGIGGIIFDGRAHQLQKIRKRLAEERLSPAEKAELEKRAASLQEAATPREVH